MSRWKMHKLGFVNFWLYDTEEFPLEHGHILLRGNNASGKSITTQSFIPFILDGNKSPERLDPFGSRDRRMEYYLLGDNEREESTGYLYLEFKKADAEAYLTIGVGMRAQRGKPMDFWGFCLNDGRRIGKGGIQLYERAGKVLLPLSRQKLKNLLNDEDNWADSPGKYKELVNNRVFQFRDLRHYEQLISLLIKVRAPKLSKESFRPSEVKRVLNDSLQVLTDEDLAAMVSTMERMDELEDTLRDLRTAEKDVRIIRNEYTRYNQYMLGQKGGAYTKACQQTLKKKCHLEDVEQRRDFLIAELQRKENEKITTGEALSRAEAQRTAMGEDDLSAKRGQLDEARSHCDGYREALHSGEEQLRRAKDDLASREIKLREQQRDTEDARAEIRSGLRRLTEINAILELGEHHETYVRAAESERGRGAEQAIREPLDRRKAQIEKVLSCLEKADRLKEVYDAACQRLDEAVTAAAEAQRVLNDARQQEQEERDRLLEAFAIRLSENTLLRLEEADMLTIKRAVSRYRSGADWSVIRDLLDRLCTGIRGALLEETIRAEQALKALRTEESELNQRLDEIRSHPVPRPPRREQIEATRLQLAMRGIPCVPFYEAVDFARELPQAERDLLETQLNDAGLLDALLIPEEHLPEVRELLQEYPDRFLLPSPPVQDPVLGLVPEQGAYTALATACLQGISRTDLNAETSLLPDGRFRSGIIRGCSRAEQPAGYVGAAARQANRERQIRELMEQLARLSAQSAEKEAELARLGADLERLQLERDAMPSSADLDQALEMLEKAKEACGKAEHEQQLRRREEQDAKEAHARAEQECRAQSLGLPYARTIAAYEEAKDAAGEYQEVLTAIDREHNKLDYLLRSVSDTEESIEQRRDDAAYLERQNRENRVRLDREQSRAEELQRFLDMPENRERVRRIQELEQEIKSLRERLQAAREACVGLETEQESVAGQIRSAQAEYTEARLDEEDLRQYFQEDLSLELLDVPAEGDLTRLARDASGRVQPSDRERTVVEIENSLRRNYQEHNNSLLQYQPKIEPVFEAPSKPTMLRQRLCITFQKEGKELSLPAFLRELQADIETTAAVLEAKDRDLFENILTETISHKLRARVEESQRWAQDMTALMQTLDTSMGLTFSLDWKPKKAETSEELDTAKLVELLNKDRALLTREDSQRVSAHFRARVRKARDAATLQELPINYAEQIRAALDYRTWYDFHLSYRRGTDPKKELTDRVFNRFSGGEKAMAMYVPLFAAVSAQYEKGGEACPRLLALDEAFAGVDDRNIGAMFELVGVLDFDYIMNSQVLWGCYSTVKDLNIAELYHPVNTQVVTILHYRWNGMQRKQEDTQ